MGGDSENAGDGDGVDSNPEDEGDGDLGDGSSSFHGTHVAGTVAAARHHLVAPSPLEKDGRPRRTHDAARPRAGLLAAHAFFLIAFSQGLSSRADSSA